MTGAQFQRSPLERLPDAQVIKEWSAVLSTAPERVFAEVEREGRHIRKMALLHFWAAVSVFFLATCTTVGLVLLSAPWPAASVASSGSVVVIITLLTGRPPRVKVASMSGPR
jgi:hypothetical protein